jgi:hypothetical protein
VIVGKNSPKGNSSPAGGACETLETGKAITLWKQFWVMVDYYQLGDTPQFLENGDQFFSPILVKMGCWFVQDKKV